MGSPLLQRILAWNDPKLSGAPERIALVQGIKQLPEGCRTIFILHEVEGHEQEEIAKLLNCSTGNSKWQLHKARMKLRKFLFPERDNGFAKKIGGPMRSSHLNWEVPPSN